MAVTKKIFINKSEKLILKSFLEAKYPKFAMKNQLANENVEYLLGLCQRCLNGYDDLAFPLSISIEEENDIEQFISENESTPDEMVFFYLMKCARLILEKYYNKDGKLIK